MSDSSEENPDTRVKMTTLELSRELREIASLVEQRDSMEGSIIYEATDERGVYKVGGCYRFGNSEGQGGVRLLEMDKKAPEGALVPAIDISLTIHYVRPDDATRTLCGKISRGMEDQHGLRHGVDFSAAGGPVNARAEPGERAAKIRKDVLGRGGTPHYGCGLCADVIGGWALEAPVVGGPTDLEQLLRLAAAHVVSKRRERTAEATKAAVQEKQCAHGVYQPTTEKKPTRSERIAEIDKRLDSDGKGELLTNRERSQLEQERDVLAEADGWRVAARIDFLRQAIKEHGDPNNVKQRQIAVLEGVRDDEPVPAADPMSPDICRPLTPREEIMSRIAAGLAASPMAAVSDKETWGPDLVKLAAGLADLILAKCKRP